MKYVFLLALGLTLTTTSPKAVESVNKKQFTIKKTFQEDENPQINLIIAGKISTIAKPLYDSADIYGIDKKDDQSQIVDSKNFIEYNSFLDQCALKNYRDDKNSIDDNIIDIRGMNMIIKQCSMKISKMNPNLEKKELWQKTKANAEEIRDQMSQKNRCQNRCCAIF